MRKKTLLKYGFKKKGNKGVGYWFELKLKNGSLITNDSLYNEGNDVWFVGIEEKANGDIYWFDEKINNTRKLKALYFILTGKQIPIIGNIHDKTPNNE